MSKKRVFSGVQPTGSLHLGNYLGAIRNWVPLQTLYDSIFCVVDLHAITAGEKPHLYKDVLETTATYLACGLDPDKCTIFRQGSISQHSELMWILTCYTKTGWLNRMTQFKDKSRTDPVSVLETIQSKSNIHELSQVELVGSVLHEMELKSESIGAGIYLYPVLMAADILLYKTDLVPVGDDQTQHIQLARDIALAFNGTKTPTPFVVPEALILPGSRIMSLRFPDKKMSKSAESDQERINLTDTEDMIRSKIKKATTDTEMLPGNPDDLNDRKGAKNLLTIYACLANVSMEIACQHFEGKGFGILKKQLTELLVAEICPIGAKIKQYMADPPYLEGILETGRSNVVISAEDTMKNIRNIIMPK